MISIKRVKVSELNDLVTNPNYSCWEVIPISLHRAKSYINNPRCSPNDIVLYLAYIESKLVGYRTVMPDFLFANEETIKVGWMSGNWVDPSQRRRGIASSLFNAAFDDWNGNLLFTNYALESKAVYDKTDRFSKVSTLKGVRTYIRPCLARVLSTRGKFFKVLKPAWLTIDFILKVLNPLPLFSRFIRLKDIRFEYHKYPDQDIISLLSKQMLDSPSRRGGDELEWIFRNPWLVSAPLGDRIGKKYYFSSSPKHFQSLLIKVYRDSNHLGFLMINNTNGFLSTPYIVYPESEVKTFAKVLLKHSFTMRCKRLTTYDEPIAKEIKGIFPFGWFSINQKRQFFATKKVASKIQNDTLFYEGDGDCAFV